MTKRKPKSEHKKSGRPQLIEKDTLSKLDQAFSNGMTDEEACLFVGISDTTLYRYTKKHPEYGKRKEALKKSPNIKAKLNIVKSMNAGDINDSKRRLERKSRDEFSTKTETETKILMEITEFEV